MNIWKERFDPSRHEDRMDSCIHRDYAADPHTSLRARWVYFAEVAGFTFEFMSLDQARECLAYFEQRLHPSTRMDIGSADHWEMQRWYERIPGHLKSDLDRPNVVRALKTLLLNGEGCPTRPPSGRSKPRVAVVDAAIAYEKWLDMRPIASVEEGVNLVNSFKGTAEEFVLAISDSLWDPVGLNMAIITDRILARGWQPAGFTQAKGYKIYRYEELK